MKIEFRVLVAAVLCGLATSCSNLNIDAIPQPGNDHRDGYDLVAEFANVLNLPDRAKVVMDGTTVGVVTDVRIAGDHVDVTTRLDRDVIVPTDVRAVLQQATVLGDIYVALEPPQDADRTVGAMTPGARIPLTQTISPPQLEDTIAHMANFIGSGSIQRAQNSLIRINSVTPATDEVRRVVSQVTADVTDLSDNIGTVDTLIQGVQQTANVLAVRTPALSLLFSQQGVAGLDRDMVLANTFGRLLPSLGTIYNGGYWLVPLITSLANALESVQGSKRAIEAEYPLYRQFIIDYFMRQDKYPAVNITSIIGPDGRELSGNVEQVLRMLGAAR
ncbi:MlaD family protein [Mycobacterium kyogaense]|uniref:MlaD family protein n=1 Tax=Mycobacterium kyogaense TaxID=2212479 RepID=UPI001F09DAAB|nr:MlaD family protein [Mycobacterium kyogaense]